MTDDVDQDRDGWLPRHSPGSQSTGNEDVDPDAGHFTREQWEKLASDPKWGENFGYDLCEWEEFSTLDDSDAIMFLPADENVLRDDSFVVADKEDVVDLGKWY
jgi:hypothetical protein